jgi:low temperature requirement protein LtrA
MAQTAARAHRRFRDRERQASWLELFFDLVFVVAIGQLAHLFTHHPDWRGALNAGGLFFAVFLA